MTDHYYSFQTTYSFPSFFNEDVQKTSELLFQSVTSNPEPSQPPTQAAETVHSRKEKQRRQALDRVLRMINAHDLPGLEHAVSYMQHKFRRNCKSCTLSSGDTILNYSISWFGKDTSKLYVTKI